MRTQVELRDLFATSIRYGFEDDDDHGPAHRALYDAGKADARAEALAALDSEIVEALGYHRRAAVNVNEYEESHQNEVATNLRMLAGVCQGRLEGLRAARAVVAGLDAKEADSGR